MENRKKKLYVGCTLSYLKEEDKVEFMVEVNKIKDTLREDFEVLDFKGTADLEAGNPLSPEEIYDYDINECLCNADYMLALCDHPGFGLGYEIGVAVEKMGIPTLAVAKRGASVSRLIRGVVNPKYEFMLYDSIPDVISKTKSLLTKWP